MNDKPKFYQFRMKSGRLTVAAHVIEGVMEDESGCTIVVPNDVYKVEDRYDDVVSKVFAYDAR